MNLPSQIDWPAAGTGVPSLAGHAVHVWAAEFREWRDRSKELEQVLSADELARARSFRVADRQVAAIVTRGLLRLLLARYCNASPAELTFSYGPHGKPALARPSAPIHFNASHSSDVAAFAFTALGDVGVDVETIRPGTPRLAEIAERFFSRQECETLLKLPEPERAAAFFRCWTRKEAFLKARGDGVFGGLSTFDVSFEPDTAALLRCDGHDHDGWWMAPLRGLANHAGAVAVRARQADLTCWRLPAAFTHAHSR